MGATTPWVDASITMINCPTFYGFYNAANSTLMFDYTTGTRLVANSTSNSIGVRLTPATSVIDATNGIMAIDSTVAGAASGVGIQIGWGVSNQTQTPFNFSAEQAMTCRKTVARRSVSLCQLVIFKLQLTFHPAKQTVKCYLRSTIISR